MPWGKQTKLLPQPSSALPGAKVWRRRRGHSKRSGSRGAARDLGLRQRRLCATLTCVLRLGQLRGGKSRGETRLQPADRRVEDKQILFLQ